MKPQERVRQAVVSGQFYSGDPAALKEQVRDLLARARSKPDPEVRGLIVPHAGYDYSGRVAAEAYKTVQGRKFDAVVVIAFLHRIFLPGVLVDDAEYYETPLGRVPVNQELARKLRVFHPLLQGKFDGRLEEHSLEVQLPFLQEVIPDLKIVPIFFGEQDLRNITALAGALAKEIKGRNVLVVATSDLSHFHPYGTAVKKDKGLIAMLERGDFEAVGKASVTEKAEACGMAPLLTMLKLSKEMGWKGPALLRYENSGDVTGERNSVVGYAAMAFKREKGLGTGEKKAIVSFENEKAAEEILSRLGIM